MKTECLAGYAARIFQSSQRTLGRLCTLAGNKMPRLSLIMMAAIMSYTSQIMGFQNQRSNNMVLWAIKSPDELVKIISDDRLERVFAGTNFGTSQPREIVADTLLKIAGGFSTGHTAFCCCQELGLLGRNKQRPRLTKLGKRYLYYSHCYRAIKVELREIV
jgi:hypothetical protein